MCRPHVPKLPAGPLFEALASAGLTAEKAIGPAAGISAALVGHARRRGMVTVPAAVRMARAIGVDLAEVYGDDWLGQASTPGDAGQARLPTEPLSQALRVAGMTLRTAAAASGVDLSGLDRAISRGTLTVSLADRLAIGALGSHPILIWGDEWLDPNAYQEGLDEVA